jgi:Flp pilus assembly pilin Flp
MSRLLRTRDERGQTMAEYSVILAIISAGIVLSLSLLSDGVATRFEQVASYLH